MLDHISHDFSSICFISYYFYENKNGPHQHLTLYVRSDWDDYCSFCLQGRMKLLSLQYEAASDQPKKDYMHDTLGIFGDLIMVGKKNICLS